MSDETSNQDGKVITLTDEHRNRIKTVRRTPSSSVSLLSEENERRLERARRSVWFTNDFLRATPPSVEALFWLTEMLSYISDDLDEVITGINQHKRNNGIDVDDE